ncbi:MAG: acetyl-CoA carboxylase biotin carboxyl carrier protein subunit [Bacteroidota bacterium]
MKVQIQNHTIEFTKENSEWAINNHPPLTLFPQGNQTILLQTTHQTIQVRCIGVDRSAKTVTLLYNNQKYTAKITEPKDELLKSMGLENALVPKIAEVKAPMPGLVLDVLVSVGQTVEMGEKILVLEAMKMENAIKSPTAGTIASIHVSKGQAVDKNFVLIRFE